MKIIISSGHGKYVRGASGYLDEVDEARKVVETVAEKLRGAGVTVVTFHDNTSTSQSQNLNTIVAAHNRESRDLDISVHFNAYQTTSKPMGCEVLYLTQSSLAAEVSAAIAEAGSFINRGAKYRSDLAFLNGTEEPAILVETCFVDSSADADLYHQHYDAVCVAIAEAVGNVEVDQPPVEPPTEPPVEPPTDVPTEENRVTVKSRVSGDVMIVVNGVVVSGEERCRNVVDLKIALEGDVVLTINGEEFHSEAGPEEPETAPPLQALSDEDCVAICKIAGKSDVRNYSWQDRGVAPIGYTQGMALAFAQSYRKLKANHPAAVEMAKARTSSDKDALNLYKGEFDRLGMSNETAGTDTLRHLYALMLGHGMRESSGRHCEGRDMSSDNVQSDTAEAGLFQTSFNAHSASDPEFQDLMAEYSDPANEPICYRSYFDDDVSCSSSEWSCYGSGDGFEFQKLCKECPAFAVETCGLTLRNLANHYGPIIRGETELRDEADAMLFEVQEYLENAPSS
jgi:hypothetical protein